MCEGRTCRVSRWTAALGLAAAASAEPSAFSVRAHQCKGYLELLIRDGKSRQQGKTSNPRDLFSRSSFTFNTIYLSFTYFAWWRQPKMVGIHQSSTQPHVGRLQRHMRTSRALIYCNGIRGRGGLHCLSRDESRRAYEASHLR
jgi:hypothetical protein